MSTTLDLSTIMKFSSCKLGFIVSIRDSVYNETIYVKGISFSGFEDGNKTERNDLLQFPGSFTLKIKLDVALAKFNVIAKELKLKLADVIVTDVSTSMPILVGSVYKQNVTAQEFEKTISIKVNNQFVDLKDVDPRTNPFGYILTDKITINNFILNLFNNPTLFRYPYISNVVNKCAYEAMSDSDGNYYTVEKWGFAYSQYFSATSGYSSLLEVIKSILTSIGCMGYIGIGSTFYIIPRYYASSHTVRTVPKELESKEVEVEVILKMRGIQMFVATGSVGEYQEAAFGIVAKNGDGSLKYPDEVEVIKHDQPVGELPSMAESFSGLFLSVDGGWHVARFDCARRKKADGSYFGPLSCWRLTGIDAWELVQKDRTLFKMKLAPAYGFTILNYLSIGYFFKRAVLPEFVLHPRYLLLKCSEDIIETEAIE